MIERIAFNYFRGFEKLELLDIKPITLISGKNNAGKSSILEGIFLFLDHLAPESFTKINRFRGLISPADSANLWESAFYQMDVRNPLQISVTFSGIPASLKYERDDNFVPPVDMNMSKEIMGQIISSAASSYTLKFTYQKEDYVEDGHFIVGPMGIVRSLTSPTTTPGPAFSLPFTQFINAAIISNNSDSFIAEWIGKLELDGKKQHIVEILKLIEPAISDLSTIVVNGVAQLFVKIDNQLLPLRLAGDGLNKLLFIILSIVVNPNSILLVDEIETGLHYSMFPKLWEIVAQAACENGCQIIASTHSYECIVGAVDGINQAGKNSAFCFYRLGKNNTGSHVYRYSDDLLQTAVAADMEVR